MNKQEKLVKPFFSIREVKLIMYFFFSTYYLSMFSHSKEISLNPGDTKENVMDIRLFCL